MSGSLAQDGIAYVPFFPLGGGFTQLQSSIVSDGAQRLAATPAQIAIAWLYIHANTRAIFGRSYAAEPDVLVKELAGDQAIKAADTLLLTIPNQLGVDYNAHAISSILKFVAPELGWR